MNEAVERFPGELAGLRLFKERVMALPEKWEAEQEHDLGHNSYSAGRDDGLQHCAADIDEALKEVGGE